MLSGKPVFLTGAPGAGKTYVLNEFVRRAQARGRRVAVTASTGIAATHIGGSTIHSWSGLGIRDSLSGADRKWLGANARLVKRYNAVDVLVIDEVSMLHGQRLDMVNEACKLLRQNDTPFGGLQVILVGDLFQLPPVSRGSDLADFAHTSAAWAELQPQICYLSEQHRQTGSDGLLELLEAMRRGDVNEFHESMLNDRLQQRPPRAGAITRLFAHNVDVDAINQKHLAAITSASQTFAMQTRGAASRVETLKRSVLAPENLELKIGAEVMFVANNFAEGFVNGSRGQVIGFKNGSPVVKLNDKNRTIQVEPHSWSLSEDGRVRAEVSQLPLRLAWAITIHKSQGMSLDAAEIDLARAFTPGMGYVALSRVRSLDGLYLLGINNMALAMHPVIYEFDVMLRQASDALANNTEDVTDEVEAKIATDSMPVDEALLKKLKQWRLQRATAESMPAYIVAHDSVLSEIAQRKPAAAQQLLALKGFGPRKLEAYGDDILKIVSTHELVQAKDQVA